MTPPSFELQFGGAVALIAAIATVVHLRARASDDVSQTYVLGWFATTAAAGAWGRLTFGGYPDFSPTTMALIVLVVALASAATLKLGSEFVKTKRWLDLDRGGRILALLISQAIVAGLFLLIFGTVVGMATVRGSF